MTNSATGSSSTTPGETPEHDANAEYRMACAISRDMRTPLAAIVGWAEVLEVGTPENLLPQLKEIGKDMRTCGEQLMKLAERLPVLFQVQQLARGPKLAGGPSAFVSGIVEDTLEDQRTKGRATGNIRLALSEGCVRMQPALFHVVLKEVVDNALKFSQPGQPVTVASMCEGDRYQVVVTDCGRGMPQAQASAGGSAATFGSGSPHGEQDCGGLGLAIVRRLCQLHGGRVSVESCEDVGTRVVISIPGESCADCSKSGQCEYRPGISENQLSSAGWAQTNPR